jgi:WD40 repeat protein
MGGHRRVGFTADGRRLIAFGDDGACRIWDMHNGQLLATTWLDEKQRANKTQYPIEYVSTVSADGATFALVADPMHDEPIRLIDPLTGRVRGTINLGETTAEHLAFSPDGKLLAVSGMGNSIETKLPNGQVRHSSAKEHPVEVWNLSERKLVWRTTSEGWMPAGLQFTPDGKRLAETTYADKSPMRFWDAASGKPAGRIDLPLSGSEFAFDRTGKRVAVALRDTTAIVYDVEAALKTAQIK